MDHMGTGGAIMIFTHCINYEDDGYGQKKHRG